VVVLGIVLIVLGLGFVLLGLVAAAREVFRRATEPATRGLPTIDPNAWEKLVRAVTELVKVAPQWLLLTFVGVGLVGVGGALVTR
jgi:hypothetical protein